MNIQIKFQTGLMIVKHNNQPFAEVFSEKDFFKNTPWANTPNYNWTYTLTLQNNQKTEHNTLNELVNYFNKFTQEANINISLFI